MYIHGGDKGAKVFMKPHLKIGKYYNLSIYITNSSDVFTNLLHQFASPILSTNFVTV